MAGKQMQQTGDLASGTEGRDFVLGQAASIVLQAPTQAGQTIEQRLESGQQAVLDFDAAAATPSVEGDNFVLSFDTDGDGASDSQVIFLGLVAQSQVADAPVLVINGVEIAANQLIGQALALAEGDGTLETAAGTGAGNGPAGGGGGSSYSDDTGESIDLLNAQGVLGETGLGATRFLNPDDATLSNFPTITAANETVILDDDDFGAHGNSGGVGDDTPINVEGTLSHNYGGDGAGSVLLLGTGAPAGFSYAVTAGGTLLTITQNGVAVMTVALGDTTSGNYKITQLAPITHPAGDDENNVDFIFNYRVTDGSGDSVDGSLRLSVDDDTPVAADPITDSVDESAIQGDTWAVAKGTITADFGADGGKFSDVTLDTNGLTAAG
ncbi:hypothetical protein, partial [Kiloniella laminariae]|uniref:hypothetical protein n=1 Tax=Kiloniella laminariae TaxID=454162 RepID=UPI00035E4573